MASVSKVLYFDVLLTPIIGRSLVQPISSLSNPSLAARTSDLWRACPQLHEILLTSQLTDLL